MDVSSERMTHLTKADHGGTLVGTLRRVYDLDGGVGAACVLVTEEGRVFHLSSLAGETASEQVPSLEALRRFESQLVRVGFQALEDTVFGPRLSGVRIEALDTSEAAGPAKTEGGEPSSRPAARPGPPAGSTGPART
jgi:hypothetical protein